MAELPKLPGFNFYDPTLTKYHVPHNFDIVHGYKMPKFGVPGIGGRELDINSVKLIQSRDPVRYDPSLTYGRARSTALPQFLPHFAMYDQKCLTFKAFFRQAVIESPLEHYRVRKVNIIYFLEDDTITVMEPRIRNSGLDQGRLVRRGRIPKNKAGVCLHWKDLQVGADILIHGIVYHTVECDPFTKEFMKSQGITMKESEEMPQDPYTKQREWEIQSHVTKTPPADDKLRRFLEYDGKVLNFAAVWDTRHQELGELREYAILYFLFDDTISVKEVREENSGRDPFPLVVRKIKIPKMFLDDPWTHPEIFLEKSDPEVTEYYQPIDLAVGSTIYILGRKMLLVDCDPFTRSYYKKALCIDQPPAIDYKPKPKEPPTPPIPPHDGIGTLEDSMGNTRSFIPKPPKKDVVRQLYNANKYLRYIMKIDFVHPEDEIRRFILKYSLGECTCSIYEPPINNSGVWGGKYLSNAYLIKPGSDRLNPTYYSPADFYIGAVIEVFKQRFVIIDADLFVYRYMQANPEKFPCEVIDNIRNKMFTNGLLKEDLKAEEEKENQVQKKLAIDAIGTPKEVAESDIEKCIKERGVYNTSDPEYEKLKRAQLLQEYEDSLAQKRDIPEHGIQKVNLTCDYPPVIGQKPNIACQSDTVGDDGYTPKHVDTPEEELQKHYADVLRREHEVCKYGKPVICTDGATYSRPTADKKPLNEYVTLMVSPVDRPPVCGATGQEFEDDEERCNKDQSDLCNLKRKVTFSECTSYKKC